MYTFRRLTIIEFRNHPIRSALPEETVFQTPGWLEFLHETQGGQPVVLLVEDSGGPVGYFTGMIISKLGLRILGSPFPGWSTSYMGFTLAEGVSRKDVLPSLKSYVFQELRCGHFEMMDRRISHSDLESLGLPYINESGYELDLTPCENELLTRMTHQTRTNIRKAIRSGLVTEDSRDPGFADEYYAQLREVFGKQGLAPTFPMERVRALIRHLVPAGHATLMRTRDGEGNSIATAIVLGSGKQAYLWGAASFKAWQHLRPNELLYWDLMRRARELGRERLDMVGEGDYKRKYGGTPYCVPWFRSSRYQILGRLRDIAQAAFNYQQKTMAKLRVRPESFSPEYGSSPDRVAEKTSAA